MINLNKLINDWKIKLSLENESIKWDKFPLSFFEQEEHTKGMIKFKHKEKYWLILFEETIKPHTFIHELGHLYLWKWLNHLESIKTRRCFVLKTPTIIRMNILRNSLLDCFVEYHLMGFEGYKKPYLSDCVNTLSLIYQFKLLITSFQYYLYRYIVYNHIIPEDIKNYYFVNIKIFLEHIKEFIMKKSTFNHEFFLKLNIKLDKFKQIKDTKNIRTIINFIYEVLSIFPYWPKDQLSVQLNQLFCIP